MPLYQIRAGLPFGWNEGPSPLNRLPTTRPQPRLIFVLAKPPQSTGNRMHLLHGRASAAFQEFIAASEFHVALELSASGLESLLHDDHTPGATPMRAFATSPTPNLSLRSDHSGKAQRNFPEGFARRHAKAGRRITRHCAPAPGGIDSLRLNTSPDHPNDPAAWLSRGQQLEAQGTPATLAEAARSYEFAIALLRSRPASDPANRRDLAIAEMNRGNALQKIGSPESLTAAVRAYDETIALLGAPGFENNPAARNSLGAAWMNRGLALHRQTGARPEFLEEALRSHRAAITILRALPLNESPWFRVNLSAAWTNLANALLDSTSADRFTAAAESARSALALIVMDEKTEPIAADLALKARRGLCDALGHLLSLNEAARLDNAAATAEAGDTVDDALSLIRHWEQQGLPAFRPLTARFLHFGAHFYRLHQPHFLAEFVLENLDPENSPGAIAQAGELHAIANEAIALALATLRAPRLLQPGDPALERMLETSSALRSAELRLADLRRAAPETK